MRIASFNIENLFRRAKALNKRTWKQGKPTLEAFARLNDVLNEDNYTPARKTKILDLLDTLGVLRQDEGSNVWLRRHRGHLLRRPRKGKVEVIATGRDDWVGWIELKTEGLSEIATQNTARVIRDVNADILGVVEVENRIALEKFASQLLLKPSGKPIYEHAMVIDGNDDRGIDVGVLLKPGYELTSIRSHVDDTGGKYGRIFSRDCPEYLVSTPTGETVLVLVNHLKSKGYARPGETVSERRRAQAQQIAKIYRARISDHKYIAVVGDLNDTPSSDPLRPLLKNTDLQDITTHSTFVYPAPDGPARPGTWDYCNAGDKIDYILLSPKLFAKVIGGSFFRDGLWGGVNGDLWPHYETIKRYEHAASDHAAVIADINL